MLPGGGIRQRTWMTNAIFEENGSLKEYWLMTGGPLAVQSADGFPQNIMENENRQGDAGAGAFALFELIAIEPGYFPQFRLVDANPAFEEFKGISIDTMLGRRLTEILPGLESDWLDMLKRIAVHGEGARLKYFYRGNKKYAEIHAFRPSPQQVAMRISDSTAPALGDESLCLSEESFRTIIENAGEGVVIAYELSDSCIFANRRASQLSGYEVDELLQIAPARFVLDAQQHNFQSDTLKRRLCGEISAERFETELLRKDGDIWPIDVYASSAAWQGRTAAIIVFREAPCRNKIRKSPSGADGQMKTSQQQYPQRLEVATKMLAQKQEELDRYKLNLERVNRELVHTNKALSIMARNIDRKGQHLVHQITQTVTSRILPALEELESFNIPEKHRVQIDIIRSYLEDLTPDAPMSSGVIAALSKTQMRVAIMIRNGFSTLEISRLLHLSDLTVKTHRKSIRKKLHISNSKINLATYLKMKLGKSQFLFNPKIKNRLDKTGTIIR